jgi:hypothetical protein
VDTTVIALAQLGLIILGTIAACVILIVAFLWAYLPNHPGQGARSGQGAPPPQGQQTHDEPQPDRRRQGTVASTAAPVTGSSRLASDVAEVAALGWPSELRRLADGSHCLSLQLGQRDGLPVDAFAVLASDYPLRPPELVVACGQQPLPLELPGLAAWSVSSSLVAVVGEALLQVPGIEGPANVRFNEAGEVV